MKPSTVAGLAFVLAAASALPLQAAKKYIFTSWEFGDATPAEVLEMGDAFDKTACDGVALNVAASCCGRRAIPDDPNWKYSDLEKLEADFRGFARHRSLRESFVFVDTAPRKRFDWKDAKAWATFANNLGLFARLAKRGGVKGLLTDFEDYFRQEQYILKPGDGMEFPEACRLARKRGAEIFDPVFREYPDITILMYQLLTERREYGWVDDPVALVREKLDLWPAFVNGMFDVLPESAKIIDGNEGYGYIAQAGNKDFFISATAQLVRLMPLIAKENRAKYRSQVSVSFGLYVDAYSMTNSSSGWYLGPVRGKRTNHLEDNLRQATACCDEYVWFWGEHGFWVDWPKRIINWTWEEMHPWNQTLDGNFDLLCRAVKDPARCIQEERARQQAAGTFAELVKEQPAMDASNHVYHRVVGCGTDELYGLEVFVRGKAAAGDVYFQRDGAWRYDLGKFRFSFGKPDADGWRRERRSCAWRTVRTTSSSSCAASMATNASRLNSRTFPASASADYPFRRGYAILSPYGRVKDR